ncbi:pilus assembly protein [Moraxella caprae]|nr:PilC/PilY family type IV pilus protein [Moraxella caprae]
MKTFSIKQLSHAIIATMTVMSAATLQSHANTVEKRIGDLEIYEAPTGGGSSVMLMLDNSGSMGFPSVGVDYPGRGCPNARYLRSDSNSVVVKKDDGSAGERVSYTRNYCTSTAYYDRMARLKDAIMPLLADPAKGFGSEYMKYKIGLGNFFYRSDVDGGGVISYPVSELTYEHRLAMAKIIAGLQANTLTPTAHAYAEAGAYMLGTTTSGSTEMADFYTLVTYGNNNPRNGSPMVRCTAPQPKENQRDTACPINGTARATFSQQLLADLGVNHQYNRGWITYYYKKETLPKGATGSGFNMAHSKAIKGNTYVSPMGDSQCDGQGIYFLTDGEPNNASGHGVALDATTSIMNAALGANRLSSNRGLCSINGNPRDIISSSSSYAGLTGTIGHPQWECIGEFAKQLASKENKVGKPILTASVGFGRVFKSASTNKKTMQVTDPITGEKSTRDVHDCSLIRQRDARNLCYLGERGHGYGQGGFYYAESSDDVARSIVEFVNSVTGSISAAPSGTVAVPTDPLSIASLQPYAYLPMLQANIAEAPATWPGNLKKYHTLNGTLYGRDGATRLYQTAGGSTFPYATNPRALDIWQQRGAADGAITTGGSYARLPAPTATNKNTVRTVYVEDAGKMKKVGVQNGRLFGFDALSASYSALDKAYILHYLGFGNVSLLESDYRGTPAQQNAKLQSEFSKAPVGKPVMGGIHHSVPALVAYQGQFDSTGNVSSTQGRQDYVLYGSMSGSLLMANASTGEEEFSFIPRRMFEDDKQRRALSPSGTGTSGEPAFGVDAPWMINAKYNYDFSASPTRITTDAIAASNNATAQGQGHIYAYGGLRMGGEGLYGLNLTNRLAPSMLFSIDSKTPGFGRMGQIWAKPVVAKIKTGTGSRGESIEREVLIFGGGYDMCYENTLFKLNDADNKDATCANKAETKGNAVYMIDSETGELVGRWTKDEKIGGAGVTTTSGLAHMNHSVVGGITALDRNNNGYIDHLYFADLGGQVFRIDLIELSGSNQGVELTNKITRGVVRVFNANEGGLGKDHIPYRFYEAPIASFYTDPNDSQRFAVVNVASGDRSSPLSRRRGLSDANRVYGIIDRDIASTRATNSLIGESGLISINLDNSNLQKMDTKLIAGASNTEAYRESLIKTMRDRKPNEAREVRVGDYTIRLPVYKHMGWYYDMIRYDGRIDVENLKAVGPGMVAGGVYYNSVYSPDFQFGSGGTCDARTIGATERQMYCMPWGVCPTNTAEKPSVNGTLGYATAGMGIQELATVAYTSERDTTTNLRTFLSAQTVQERASMANTSPSQGGGLDGRFVDTAGKWVNAGAGVDLFGQPQIDRERYNLRVNRWYDFQNAER